MLHFSHQLLSFRKIKRSISLSVFLLICTSVFSQTAPGIDGVKVTGTLPVMYITTENNAIIESKEDYLSATFYIDAMGLPGFESVGSPTKQQVMQIRGRGNSSWTFDKKPYKLKLDKKTALLGMPKHKHWVLLAHTPSLEFMNERVSFELARRAQLGWVPREQAVEVVLNGRSIGLYALSEQVKIDSNRLDIYEQEDFNTDESTIPGGWLIEIDNTIEESQIAVKMPDLSFDARFTHKTPELLSDQQRTWITNELDSITAALFDADKTSEHWLDYIDLDAAARYYIVQELTCNYDCYSGSTYLNKDTGGKWKFGPIWDSGWTFPNRTRTGTLFDDRSLNVGVACEPVMIREMLKSYPFLKRVRELWHEMKSDMLTGINEYADTQRAQLTPAFNLNYDEIWPKYKGFPIEDGTTHIKLTLANYAEWMDNYVDSFKYMLMPVKSDTINAGESVTYQPELSPALTSATLVWSCDDESIAKINSATGEVTGQQRGTTTVRVATDQGQQAHYQITVLQPVTSLTFDAQAMNIESPTSTSVYPDTTLTSIVTVLPENANDKTLTFTSNNEEVATVDSTTGIIKTLALGEAVITATATSGVTTALTVNVVPRPVTKIIIADHETTFNVGDTVKLSATTYPENATYPNVVWLSSDESIASVEATTGKVTALFRGVVTISAQAHNGLTESTELTILQPVTSLAFDAQAMGIESATAASLYPDTTLTAVVTILPENANDKTLTFATSNEAVVSIDASTGVFTTHSLGEAIITATATSGVETKLTVNVVPRPVTKVEITPTDTSIEIENTLTLSATAYPENATYRTITWMSSNESVATVNSSTGEVNAIYPGNVTITATAPNGVSASYNLIIYPHAGVIPTEIYLSATKLRQGNTLTLSTDEPQLGYEGGWTYQWMLSGSQFSTDDVANTIVNPAISNGESTSLTYSVVITNSAPDGTVWAQATLTSQPVTVYNRPEALNALLRKGNSTSNTVIAMSPLSDAQLASQNYKFVYGHNDNSGKMVEIATTPLRYCMLPSSINITSPSETIWCYPVLSNSDGTLIAGSIVYLDGRVDNDFDASIYDGSQNIAMIDFSQSSNWFSQSTDGSLHFNIDSKTGGEIIISNLQGIVIHSKTFEPSSAVRESVDLNSLQSGIYIVAITTDNQTESYKIIIP